MRKEFDAFGGSLAVQTDFKYSAASFAGISNAPAQWLRSNFIVNSRISFVPGSDNWDISIFVNNVTDAEVPINAFDLTSSFGYNLIAYAPPRWFGARVGFKF